MIHSFLLVTFGNSVSCGALAAAGLGCSGGNTVSPLDQLHLTISGITAPSHHLPAQDSPSGPYHPLHTSLTLSPNPDGNQVPLAGPYWQQRDQNTTPVTQFTWHQPGSQWSHQGPHFQFGVPVRRPGRSGRWAGAAAGPVRRPARPPCFRYSNCHRQTHSQAVLRLRKEATATSYDKASC